MTLTSEEIGGVIGGAIISAYVAYSAVKAYRISQKRKYLSDNTDSQIPIDDIKRALRRQSDEGTRIALESMQNKIKEVEDRCEKYKEILHEEIRELAREMRETTSDNRKLIESQAIRFDAGVSSINNRIDALINNLHKS